MEFSRELRQESESCQATAEFVMITRGLKFCKFDNETEHGRCHQCGCVDFDTILPDGSLGWGCWTESCWDHMNG